MRIIFSRKGFDSAAGGAPSPIVGGVPVSLPIPSGPSEPFRYADLSHPQAGPLAPLVEQASKGRITARHPAHADPVVIDGPSALGQQGAAQSHLLNQGVTTGDVFVFFGLFQSKERHAPKEDQSPHHRIFGMLRVEDVIPLGETPNRHDPRLAPWSHHPHVVRPAQQANNTLWVGTGLLARSAHPGLRLSLPGGSPSTWTIPSWLRRHGLSYHARPDRWTDTTLRAVARGQEFVSHVGDDTHPQEWLVHLARLLALPAGS